MKKLKMILSASLLTLSFAGSASAEGLNSEVFQDQSAIPTVSTQVGEQGTIGTLALPKYGGAGTFYEFTSKNSGKTVDYQFKIQHLKGTSTSHTKSVTVEGFTELSVGSETELKIIGQSVKATAELKAGARRSVTTTITWTTEPTQASGSYMVSTGKDTMKTTGYLETANSGGVVTSRKYVNAYYTVTPYSDIKPI